VGRSGSRPWLGLASEPAGNRRVQLPGMSGLDLLRIVKTRRPDLPVFVISDYGDAERVKTALARGADGFLTKPVDFPKLKQDIMAVMTDTTGENG
jgi:DNA-binding NarL/FixJ family response regulator